MLLLNWLQANSLDKGKRQTIYQTDTGMAFKLAALEVLGSQ